MRKLAAVAASAVLLTVGLQAPAWAADPATDFELSWLNAKLHLTWKDNGEQNIVLAEYDGQQEPVLFANLAAGEPNDIQGFSNLQPADKVRFILRTVAADGSSVDTLSPWFDTRGPAAPALQDANLLTNLSTTLKWTQGAVEDKTPGDPLDVPGNGTVKAVVDLPGTATKSYPFAAGTTTGTIPAQARPAAIKLIAVNEWTETADTKTVRLGTLGAGITVPASAAYGNRLGIKSTLDLFTSEGREERASSIKVELQARTKTTDAWKTYGRYTGNTTTAFDTGIASLGNRQYRLWVPARKVVSGNVIALTPASSTSAKSSKTLVKFLSKGFTPAHPARHANVDVWAKIQPAATVRGTLQVLLNNKWSNVFPVQFRNGSMLTHANVGNDRGHFLYRIALPATTINGLPLSPTTSSAFPITIG
ncbi:hypothetical protein GCM10009745_61260 [Kribbella yunnanensis]|uniref:DNRLRE domain-containing protein n=1 Tax=Kribbella yunnanensis TaxID=190194 RepID=A0ABP4UGQ3_9ACTN